jgi:titin
MMRTSGRRPGLRTLIALTAMAVLARPAAAVDIVVDSLADPVDAGFTTLRDAINMANATTDPDVIKFDVAGVILLSNDLPTITEPVTVDGFTAPGSSPNTNPITDPINAVHTVEVTGNFGAFNAFLISANDCTIRGLAITKSGRAVQITGDDNHVCGSFIDENSTGVLIASADRNVVGTNGDGVDDDAERNHIVRNTNGVRIVEDARDNVVAGNFIGTSADGTMPMGNAEGVVINQGALANRVGTDGDGTADLAERNLISGNIDNGVLIENAGTTENVVAGNLIGTDRTGTVPVANGGNGVRIQGDANQNIVGTNGDGAGDAQERNVISANDLEGVRITAADANIVAGNLIGTDITGQMDRGNAREGVLIFSGSAGNVVGTNGDGSGDAAEGNVISGNGGNGGVVFQDAIDNVVAGNLIGTDVDGLDGIDNVTGVEVFQSSGTRIGTNGDGVSDGLERNVLSYNEMHGVFILRSGTTVVAGNLIGTDVTGLAAAGNGEHGVSINDANTSTIGTNGDGMGDDVEGNVISANATNGVDIFGSLTSGNVVAGNLIGTDATGTGVLANQVQGIQIRGSSEIRIGTDGDGTGDVAERNVISGNGFIGVATDMTTDSTIAGNFIGTDVTGRLDLGNASRGVELETSDRIVIGTNGDGMGDDVEGNLISGNVRPGVEIERGEENVVAGNRIGTDVDGLFAIPNDEEGVRLREAHITRIGTDGNGMSDVAERNLISGNGADGVSVIESLNTVIAGNFIGTDVMCEMPIPNAAAGVLVTEFSSSRIGLSHFLPGNPAHANVIAFNDGPGVEIGPPDAALATLNGINGNSMFGNGRLGIDLRGGVEDVFGVTANDPNDPDPGPNTLQNFPVITSVDALGNIQAVLSTPLIAGIDYLIEFFASSAVDPSGHGEGERLIGRVVVTSDGSGVTPINAAFTIPGDMRFVTATATQYTGLAMQPNTSEFSRAFEAPQLCLLPGRPATDGSEDRVLRGYVVGWAVDQFGNEIRWNHLAGAGTVVNYRDGGAWEYTTFNHAVVSGVDHGAATGTPGVLHLDGVEYAPSFEQLLLNFQAAGSDGFSAPPAAGFVVTSDTDLTLLPSAADLRQSSDGPVTTKASVTVWNENETKFSGTHRCVTCWDQTLLSRYAAPNHFLHPFLQTDHGKARIEGEASVVCDVLDDPATPQDESVTSVDAPLLGVAARQLRIMGMGAGGRPAAGTNLFGLGVDTSAAIRFDPSAGGGPPEGQEPDAPTRGPRLDAGTARLIESFVSSVTDEDVLPPEAVMGTPQDRVSGTEKGSLFFFAKVEIRWNTLGEVVQDTFLSLTNDHPEDVRVQMYFVNGDPPLLEDPDGLACFHPGWNWVDVGITLTGNEPAYWSALTGQPKGVSPFTVLDP